MTSQTAKIISFFGFLLLFSIIESSGVQAACYIGIMQAPSGILNQQTSPYVIEGFCDTASNYVGYGLYNEDDNEWIIGPSTQWGNPMVSATTDHTFTSLGSKTLVAKIAWDAPVSSFGWTADEDSRTIPVYECREDSHCSSIEYCDWLGSKTCEPCSRTFSNACDTTDTTGCKETGSIGCNADTSSSDYNCADLTSDSNVGSEDDEPGWCPTLASPGQDSLDNDCDNDVDDADWDCPTLDCGSGDEERPCLGYSGDLADVEQTDGLYCDTNPSPNRCCPTGEIWDSGSVSCVSAAPGCNPSPCNEEPMTAAWWSDSNCITASQGCCYDSIQHGEPYYQYEAPVAY